MSEPTDLDALTDAVAERLSWEGGEMTRWSETAHEDHNRWSWRGDGHGAVMREEYLRMARGAVDAVLSALDGLGASARAEVDPESTDDANKAQIGGFFKQLMRTQAAQWEARHGDQLHTRHDGEGA